MAAICTFIVAACLSASAPPTPPQAVVERWVFSKSLSAFIRESLSPRHDQRLNWNTDGCSAPIIGSSGRSFDFYDACKRHDFAYRNFSTLDNGSLWTPTLRARVDAVFRRDMLRSCANRSGSFKASCRNWAEVFYAAVRAYAGP